MTKNKEYVMETMGQLEKQYPKDPGIVTTPINLSSITLGTNEVIAIFGIRGYGKTFLFKKAIIPELSRVIIYDHVMGYPDDGYISETDLKKKWKNWYIFTHPRDLYDKMIEAGKPKNKNKKYYIVYRPIDHNMAVFEFFCRIVYSVGNFFMVVDEMADVCTPNRITDYHGRILRVGRHQNIGYCGLTQRPAAVHNLFKSQVSKAFAFRLLLPADLKYLKDWFGEEMHVLRQLDHYQFLYCDGDKIIQMKPIKEKETLTVDKTPPSAMDPVVVDVERERITKIVDEIEENY